MTNIASVLGALFMLAWMITAIFLTKAPVVYARNALMALMFLMVLWFNRIGWRVFASVWLMVASFTSVLLFLFLLGYSSGVAICWFMVIILPYMSFPRKARMWAHGFSLMACLLLMASVLFQTEITVRHDVFDLQLLQVVNISMPGLICLLLVWRLSVLVDRSEDSLIAEQKKSDNLLQNILPEYVIKDLKDTGKTIPKRHRNVSILFTDFKGFTELVPTISATKLMSELNDIFGRFDELVEQEGVEKIKTIGDAYVAVCGVENEIPDHAIKCIRVAQRMLAYLEKRNRTHKIKWSMRIGIHSGPIVTGVIGKKKFSYDLFGDTINTASRMESAGEAGRINISGATYHLIRDVVACEYRGEIFVKGKGDMAMYFVRE